MVNCNCNGIHFHQHDTPENIGTTFVYRKSNWINMPWKYIKHKMLYHFGSRSSTKSLG